MLVGIEVNTGVCRPRFEGIRPLIVREISSLGSGDQQMERKRHAGHAHRVKTDGMISRTSRRETSKIKQHLLLIH